MPIRIDVTIKGLFPKDFEKTINTLIVNVDKSIEQLANETVDHMRGVIKTKTYRSGSTGNLAKAIQSYKIDGGYGVGDVAYMNQPNVAPYWALMNYGGNIAPGYFGSGKFIYGNFEGDAPDSEKSGSNPGGGNQRFTKGAFPLYRISPKFPVMPKNYIEDTVSWLYSYISGIDLSKGRNILP